MKISKKETLELALINIQKNKKYNLKRKLKHNNKSKGEKMSNFRTKKYTRPVLLANISKLPMTAFNNITALANALSPRAGRKSAQFAALKNFVNLNKAFKAQKTSLVKQYILRSLNSQESQTN